MIEIYQKKPVGRAVDYTNQIIGDYKILYRIEKPTGREKIKDTFWLGECSLCHQVFPLTGATLKRGICKCKCRDDLTNKIFGRWTVQYDTGRVTKNRSRIWHCKCDCGNEKDVDGYTLKSGQSISCGCYQKEKAKELCHNNYKDITGQRFGKLVALYPIFGEKSGKHTKWHCHCDCGNEVDIDLGNLQQGFSQSCGCVISTQEERIIQLLTQYNIPFQYQYKFQDLPYKIFDFFVDKKYIIEYDGQQHFGYNGYGWNTKENFDKTRASDTIKNEYCFNHNIPIIRIPYTQKDIFSINDLILDKTKFLLTQQQVDKYYKDYSFQQEIK